MTELRGFRGIFHQLVKLNLYMAPHLSLLAALLRYFRLLSSNLTCIAFLNYFLQCL